MTESEAKTKVCHRTIESGSIPDKCIGSVCMRWVEDRGCMDNLVFVRPEIQEVRYENIHSK